MNITVTTNADGSLNITLTNATTAEIKSLFYSSQGPISLSTIISEFGRKKASWTEAA